MKSSVIILIALVWSVGIYWGYTTFLKKSFNLGPKIDTTRTDNLRRQQEQEIRDLKQRHERIMEDHKRKLKQSQEIADQKARMNQNKADQYKRLMEDRQRRMRNNRF